MLPKQALLGVLTTIVVLNAISASAATSTVSVVDENAQPFSGAVVEVLGENLTTDDPVPSAVMDQVNSQFEPHILVVQKHAAVSFPNSDSIKHHVYSFSPAKPFELQLYKGRPPEPEQFNKAGVVAMGCNVHDWMVGYIYVANSKYVKRTDKNGQVVFDLPDGDYSIKVWHPRIKPQDINRLEKITTENATFKLTQPLHPEIGDDIDEFSDY